MLNVRYYYISSLMVSAFDSGSSGSKFESWPELLHSVFKQDYVLSHECCAA